MNLRVYQPDFGRTSGDDVSATRQKRVTHNSFYDMMELFPAL